LSGLPGNPFRPFRVTSGLLMDYCTRMAAKCAPCQGDMASPQNAGAGYDLYMWRASTNILNQELQTVDKGQSSSLVLWWGK